MLAQVRYDVAPGTLDRFARLVKQRLGIRADVGDLRAALVERLMATNVASEGAYFDIMNSPQAAKEWSALAKLLVVPETYFFRNREHWKAFTQHVIPRIVDRQNTRETLLRIWSAGCSTGEEPYTIAMALAEMGLSEPVRGGGILATDLVEEALAAGRRAVYGPNSLRGVQKERTHRFSSRKGRLLTVNDEIRQAVTFSRLNLADPTAVAAFIVREGPFHVIFCRNVLIYLAPRVCGRLLDQFAIALVPGGTLFLGHSEFPHMWTDSVEPVPVVDTFVFRKRYGVKTRECVEEWSETAAGREASNPPMTASANVVREHAKPTPPAQVTQESGQSRGRTSRAPCASRSTEPPATAHSGVGATEPGRHTDRDLWSKIAKVLEHTRRGRDAEALSGARRLVEECELTPEAYYAFGVASEMAGETADAVDAYRKAVFLDSGFAHAHWRLAQVLSAWKQTDAAASEAQWAVRTIANESDRRLRYLSGIERTAVTRMMEQTLEWLLQQRTSPITCPAS